MVGVSSVVDAHLPQEQEQAGKAGRLPRSSEHRRNLITSAAIEAKGLAGGRSAPLRSLRPTAERGRARGVGARSCPTLATPAHCTQLMSLKNNNINKSLAVNVASVCNMAQNGI